MKKYKYITTFALATLLSESVLPSYQVQAKNESDIWPFGADVSTSYIDSTADGVASLFYNYTGSIVPREFSVPNVNKATISIQHIYANLNSKSIQYVSFINVKLLRNIGYYPYSDSGHNARESKFPTFKNNEIRKIYWNSDDFYSSNINIWDSSFENNKIQSLDLPKKVVGIKKSAFKGNEISWMNWEGVKEIGESAFQSNKLVSSLPNGYKFKIPKGLTAISQAAFYNNNLTHIDIPENILSVSQGAFGQNPIDSIYFENPNTVIDANILNTLVNVSGTDRYAQKPFNYQSIIIYGHGETSTAKTFANRFGGKYINVDQYDNAVFDAEESMSEEKLNDAYEKINAMAEGEMKEDYLKRLDNLNHAFEIEKYVSKSEQTLTDIKRN